MLTIFYHIDWWLLFFNSLWILGASIILITLSFYEFSVKRSRTYKGLNANNGWFKKFLAVGAILLIIGTVLSIISHQKREAIKKTIFVDFNLYDPDKIDTQDVQEILSLSPLQLKMAGSYHIEDMAAILWSNGYVETPFVDLKAGVFEFEFEALGSKAYNEFPKIWAALLVIQDGELVLGKPVKEWELSGQLKKYSYKLENNEDQIGKIRIHFFNDLGDAQGGDRNVWIKNVKIRRILNETVQEKNPSAKSVETSGK